MCVTEIVENGRVRCRQIPEPRESRRKLLEARPVFASLKRSTAWTGRAIASEWMRF